MAGGLQQPNEDDTHSTNLRDWVIAVVKSVAVGGATFAGIALLDRWAGGKAALREVRTDAAGLTGALLAPLFAEQERARRESKALKHTINQQSDLIEAIAEGHATIHPVRKVSHNEALAQRRNRVAEPER